MSALSLNPESVQHHQRTDAMRGGQLRRGHEIEMLVNPYQRIFDGR
jgi:hypothetical protein